MNVRQSSVACNSVLSTSLRHIFGTMFDPLKDKQ